MNDWKLGNKVKIRFIWMDFATNEKRNFWIQATVVGKTSGGHPEVLFLDPVTAEYKLKALQFDQIQKLD